MCLSSVATQGTGCSVSYSDAFVGVKVNPFEVCKAKGFSRGKLNLLVSFAYIVNFAASNSYVFGSSTLIRIDPRAVAPRYKRCV